MKLKEKNKDNNNINISYFFHNDPSLRRAAAACARRYRLMKLKQKNKDNSSSSSFPSLNHARPNVNAAALARRFRIMRLKQKNKDKNNSSSSLPNDPTSNVDIHPTPINPAALARKMRLLRLKENVINRNKNKIPQVYGNDVISSKKKRKNKSLLARKLAKAKKKRRRRKKATEEKQQIPYDLKLDDLVMLKVSPLKGVMRFRTGAKLSPNHIGPFKVLKTVGSQFCKLALPEELKGIHDTFHVSFLKKYDGKECGVIPVSDLKVESSNKIFEDPESVLEARTKKFGNKDVELVLVKWKHTHGRRRTWEPKEEMKIRYPDFVDYDALPKRESTGEPEPETEAESSS